MNRRPRFKIIQAAAVDIVAVDVSVDLPLAPGPLFSARRFAFSGPVVSARQATAREPSQPPPLALLVGARRAAPSRHPAAPPRPPIKFYTDVDVTLEGAGGCFATVGAVCASCRHFPVTV